jgi:hypothetical protein
MLITSNMFQKSKGFSNKVLKFKFSNFLSMEKKWEGEEHKLKTYLQALMFKNLIIDCKKHEMKEKLLTYQTFELKFSTTNPMSFSPNQVHNLIIQGLSFRKKIHSPSKVAFKPYYIHENLKTRNRNCWSDIPPIFLISHPYFHGVPIFLMHLCITLLTSVYDFQKSCTDSSYYMHRF